MFKHTSLWGPPHLLRGTRGESGKGWPRDLWELVFLMMSHLKEKLNWYLGRVMRDPEEPQRPRLRRFESSKRLYQQGWDLLLTRFLLLLLNLLFYIYDFFLLEHQTYYQIWCVIWLSLLESSCVRNSILKVWGWWHLGGPFGYWQLCEFVRMDPLDGASGFIRRVPWFKDFLCHGM